MKRLATNLRLILLFFIILVIHVEAKPDHITYLEWHHQCLSGETETIDKQIKKFSSRIKTNPKDALARAYLGSSHALRAKASFWGHTKLSHLKKGRKFMDQAVATSPKNPRVRMVRAIGYYKVPKRFKVRDTALADFEKLMPIISNPKSHLATNERQAILYYAYLTFKEEGHQGAAEAKKRCYQLAPHSKYGKRIKSL